MNDKKILKVTSGALLCTMLAYTSPVLALTKEETVYSKIDTNGSNYSTIVNNHLMNEEREKLINDLSDLMDIENVNGDEEVEQDGNKLIWKANESDIYYQGKTNKELPIECKVTYELDGKEISAKDLAGKSGKVTIRIEYSNKDEHMVQINGQEEKLYTPFVVVCGTIINNQNNRDIKITSGKVIDDGSKTIVMGMAFPGLQESLDVDKEKIDIPNIVEITMETTDFELNNIITYLTPKVIEESDLNAFNELDEIYRQANSLSSSSKQLVEGANTLEQGTSTYSEKSQEFNTAMKQVASGANSANKSYSQIHEGIVALNKSTNTLQEGSKTISEGSKALATNLKTASQKLEELQKGSQTLLEGQKSITAGVDKIVEGMENVNVTSNTDKIAELEKLVAANQTAITSLETANTQLTANLSNADSVTSKNIQEQITANKQLIQILKTNITANQETITTLKQTDMSHLQELQTGLKSLKQGMQALQTGTKSLYDGQTAMKQGIDTLATKTEELAQGTNTLYQGTAQITQGTKSLNAGSNQMKNGLNTLDEGTQKLSQADNELTQGANTISEGAKTLADGITKFDKEGIQTICNYINGDLKQITVRIEKLQELAEEYNNFTMLNDGTNGNVKFIMIMDGIKKETSNKQEMIIDEKEQKAE